MKKILLVTFSTLILSACTSFKNENYKEPSQEEPQAKVTFAQSNKFNGRHYLETFNVQEYEGNFLAKTRTELKFDNNSKNRNFGIPVPDGFKILYNVYIPANTPMSFVATGVHDWYTNVNNTSKGANRYSTCSFDDVKFTPNNGSEYLVLLDNIREDIKDAPRCSLKIKELIREKSGDQWVDIEYKFSNKPWDIMRTYEIK